MSNEVATRNNGGAVADQSAIDNPFAQAGAGAGSTIFVKYKGQGGVYSFGQDEEEIQHGTLFAVDIPQSKWSWSFWWDGEVLETLDTFVVDDPMGWDNEPDFLPEDYDGDMSLKEIRAEQADRDNNFMDGWSCQSVLPMRGVDGDDEEYTLKLNKGVALNAFRTLLGSFGRQFKFKVGLVPIISLDAKKYKSKIKSVGWRAAPVLKIEEWRSEEELLAGAGENPEDYDTGGDGDADDAAPEAEAAPADEAEKEAPKRGRRGARGRGNFDKAE